MLNKPYKTIGECKVFGNNHSIFLINWWDLTKKEKKNFDYFNNPEDDFTGFRYKGNVYGLDEFMRMNSNNPFNGLFDSYISDTFFSGIGIKFTEDNETLKAYTFYS